MPLTAIPGKTITPITVSNTAVVLRSQLGLNSEQENALAAVDISVQTNSIYVRYDGVNSITNPGVLLAAGTIYRFTNRQDALRAIMWRATGSDATVVAVPMVGQ